MFNFASQFESGFSYQDFLQKYGTDQHRDAWQGVHQQIQLSSQQMELLSGFKREMKVLCMAGAWCGDCVRQCPIFDHFAAATDKIQLRFVDRDEDEDLKAELTLCGGARVPQVVFLNENDQFVGRFGDRTLSKYRQMAHDLGASCPPGVVQPPADILQTVTQEWLDEFERIQLILRTSPGLRGKHGD